MQKLLLNLVLRLLRKQKGENKTLIINALLEKVDALPIGRVLYYQEGVLYVSGRELSREQELSLKEGINSLRNSIARKVVRDQIKHLAVEWGIKNGLTPETIQFSKAALWVIEQEEDILAQFAE